MNTEDSSKNFVNLYCDISFNTVCRLCLEKTQPHKKMSQLFEPKQNLLINDLPGMIMACASVQIIDGDGLPNMICNKCLAKLNVAWQFKLQCENSDAKLRQFYFNSSSQLPLTTGFEGFGYDLKHEQHVCLLKSDPEVTNTYNSTTELVPANNISTVLSPKREAECKKVKTKKIKRQRREIEKKELKIHQCDTCGKTFNRREYLTQHIRIHTGEKPYHCHLCEKRFVNSGHLTTHMRTHTGERPHSCSQCPKAFSTRQELHKHTMVHNGERPFVCKMCGKCFGSSSNLYSHLKHHTGEKNFTCEHCGKAFYTKQELKQHLVVHTGEKAFLCELCNKRFSQIAHLRRHSKLHQ